MVLSVRFTCQPFSLLVAFAQIIWGGGYIKCVSRFLQLVVPTLVIGLIGSTVIEWRSVHEFFFDANRAGYWFCITLFEAYLVYQIIGAIIKKFSLKSQSIVYLFLFIACFAALYLRYNYLDDISNYAAYQLIGVDKLFLHLPFFLLGVIANMNRDYFERIIKNNWLMCLAMVLYILFISIISGRFSTNFKPFFAILILFRIFSMSQNFFSSNNKFGKILVYVGQRTLPIYLVHYFFIEGMRNISPSFRELVQENWFFEIIIVSAIAIMICGACLAVEKILQKFPLLHSLAFGFKIKKK